MVRKGMMRLEEEVEVVSERVREIKGGNEGFGGMRCMRETE